MKQLEHTTKCSKDLAREKWLDGRLKASGRGCFRRFVAGRQQLQVVGFVAKTIYGSRQFSTVNPETHVKCVLFPVTSVRPFVSAVAAMIRSASLSG